MKRFVVPEPVSIGQMPFTVGMLIEHLVDREPQFNDNRAGLRSGDKCVTAFQAVAPGGHVILDDADAERLVAAAVEPKRGYPEVVLRKPSGEQTSLKVGRQLLPLVDALAEPEDYTPAKPEPVEETTNAN